MTRQEAIERLKQNKSAAKFYAGMAQNTNAIENELKDIEAIDMAIEALTSQNLTEPNNTCEVDLISREDAVNENGDLIYRADAIEAIQNAYCKPCKERGDDHNEVRCRACAFDDAMNQIDSVPSAKGGDEE